ncbi:MAG: DUF4252 domain-containing protein [Bacteroidales bacterium]|nr:DUF4252 domain-containing protein [Bacteroidales bacterium]
MRNWINITIISLLLTGCLGAKYTKGYHDFYKKYKGSQEVVSFKLPKTLIWFFLLDEESKEARKALKNVDHINFFIADDSTKTLLKILYNYLPESEYKDAMIIKDGNDIITFKARENDKGITEMLMLIESEDSFVVMNIEGKFTYDDMKTFTQSVDVKKVSSAESSQGKEDDE